METNEGNNKKIIVTGLIVVAIGLVIFGFYKSKNPTEKEIVTPTETASPLEEYVEQIVNTKHQYKNGTHTYAGELDLGTPCDTLQYDVVKDPVNKQNIEINFKTISEQEGGCAQVVTAKPFKVTFEGPEKVNIVVTLDGKKIKFNLFEVPPKENIDTFDLHIKG